MVFSFFFFISLQIFLKKSISAVSSYLSVVHFFRVSAPYRRIFWTKGWQKSEGNIMFRENRFSHADPNARVDMDGHEARTSPSSEFHFAKLKKKLA